MSVSTVVIDRQVRDDELTDAFREDAIRGLTAREKRLPWRWFWNDDGCRLFKAITDLPDYYLPRIERRILQARAREIAEVTSAESLVELGSGTSDRSRLLLNALKATGTLRRFVPFQLDETTLEETAKAAADEAAAGDYDLEVRAVLGDFDCQLDALPPGQGRQLVVLLGSAIGNFDRNARAAFFTKVARVLRPGDAFLLGVDLVRDPERLKRAYDDAGGVTAAFNLNLLARLNRELNADFERNNFDHVAEWHDAESRVEMFVQSKDNQQIVLRKPNLAIDFRADEGVQTEISTKFDRETLETELRTAGLQPVEWWENITGDYGLTLFSAPSGKEFDTRSNASSASTSRLVSRTITTGSSAIEAGSAEPPSTNTREVPARPDVLAYLEGLALDSALQVSLGRLTGTMEDLLARHQSEEDRDLLEQLSRIAVHMALSQHLKQQLSDDVDGARRLGASWRDISKVTGVDRHAARRRWDPDARRRHRDYQRERLLRMKPHEDNP